MFYIGIGHNTNNQEIFNIQYLLNSKVAFEPPHKKKEIV